MRKYVLDDNNKPIPCDDISAWGKWYEIAGDRMRVALTERDGIKVSTVFLGLDHAFTNGPPVLWETMIFGGPHDQWQDRYTSHEDAVRGHAKAVELAFTADAVDPHVGTSNA